MREAFNSEAYLLRRAGYGSETCVVLCRMECAGVDRNATYDPYAWGGGTRTYQVAHEYIIEHFDELTTGDVIDVEYILGETTTKKESERATIMSAAIQIQINSLADAAKGRKCFPEFENTKSRELYLHGMAILEAGMQSGKTSTILVITSKDKKELINVQVSADMFDMMYHALKGARERFGDV